MRYETVNLGRVEFKKCMACASCKKIFTDATTVFECRHTFCKECISEKLSDDEELECCPKCETDLGSVTQQKSGSDPDAQELRPETVNPRKRKIDIDENMPYATTPEFPPQSPVTSTLKEGEMQIHPWFSNLMNQYGVTITPDIYRLFELDKFTDQSAKRIEAKAAALQQVEPFGGLFTVFCHYGSAVLKLEETNYQLSAENQKLRAELAASKAANSALSGVERRLKAKEAEVDELHKKCNNFRLGISNVENELKKIKQSVSK